MSAVLDKTATSQASDAALIEEVNRRIKAGYIDTDAIDLPDSEEKDEAAGGGMLSHASDEINWHALEEAHVRFARRDYPETLYQLEKALGRDFSGLGDLVLGRR